MNAKSLFLSNTLRPRVANFVAILNFKQHSPTEGCQFCGYFKSQTNFSCVGCFSCERHLWGCFCCCCCKKCQNVTSLFLQ
ncbi:membrane protein E6A [Equid gammaherpesvirus 2]|nr:membrane protein E6A [Equid gammaherpesvirus 2]